MKSATFYRSVKALLDPLRLRNKKVAVIGLGSGGSRVAAELGRLGVQLLLVDRPKECLEEHNLVRHVLDSRSLGKSKLCEMAKYIRHLNPWVTTKSYGLDVVDQQADLQRTLARWRPDAVAVCTDNEPSKHAINELALLLDIPQTGGAVYDGGIGGEVYRIRRGQACYGCLAHQLRLERQMPKEGVVQDYGNSGNNEAPTRSALSLDIAQIALLQCRLTLELLLESDGVFTGLPEAVNLCVFANRIVPGTFARPWHCEFFEIERCSDCLACGLVDHNVTEQAAKILSALHTAN